MTSNAGSSQKGGSVGFGRSLTEQSKEKAMKALGEFLRPRSSSTASTDEIVCFNQLSEGELPRYRGYHALRLRQSLEGRGIAFAWDESVKDYLVKKSIGRLRRAQSPPRHQTDLEPDRRAHHPELRRALPLNQSHLRRRQRSGSRPCKKQKIRLTKVRRIFLIGSVKPGSVIDSHLSRRIVADTLQPPLGSSRAGTLLPLRCCSG